MKGFRLWKTSGRTRNGRNFKRESFRKKDGRRRSKTSSGKKAAAFLGGEESIGLYKFFSREKIFFRRRFCFLMGDG
jgi:hypothetical protein